MKIDLNMLFAVFVGLSTLFIGWFGHARATKSDIESKAEQRATMAGDITYIKKSVDTILHVQEGLCGSIDELDTRVTKIETKINDAVEPRIKKLEEKVFV